MGSHESSSNGKRILAYGGAPVAIAAIAFGVGQLRGGEDKPKTVGHVPAVETCGPEVPETTVFDTPQKVRAALAYKVCRTAVTVATDVVTNKAPFEGMPVTESTTEFGTKFGKPSYTITQKSAETVDPTNTQVYSVTFGVNAEGKGDLSNIIELTADNGTNNGVIDSYSKDGKVAYVAGFHDPQEGDTPLAYVVNSEAGAARAQDAGTAALAAFVPWKS